MIWFFISANIRNVLVWIWKPPILIFTLGCPSYGVETQHCQSSDNYFQLEKWTLPIWLLLEYIWPPIWAVQDLTYYKVILLTKRGRFVNITPAYCTSYSNFWDLYPHVNCYISYLDHLYSASFPSNDFEGMYVGTR